MFIFSREVQCYDIVYVHIIVALLQHELLKKLSINKVVFKKKTRLRTKYYLVWLHTNAKLFLCPNIYSPSQWKNTFTKNYYICQASDKEKIRVSSHSQRTTLLRNCLNHNSHFHPRDWLKSWVSPGQFLVWDMEWREHPLHPTLLVAKGHPSHFHMSSSVIKRIHNYFYFIDTLHSLGLVIQDGCKACQPK